jgi:hypothetical protein
MMRTIGAILQVFLCIAAAIAQPQQHGTAADTSRVHQVVIVDPGIALGKPILLLPPALATESTAEPFFVPGMRPTLPPPLIGGAYELKVDLISPYLLQRQKAQQYSTLTAVLGSIQVGGVAYLAYRHIKKYGLFR